MSTNIFETDEIGKLYRKMAMPVVLSSTVSLIYNLTDTYFVASTNNTALVAGVSLGAPVFMFLMALGNIFGQGGASLLSRLLGGKEHQQAGNVSAWCFYGSLVVGVITAVILLVIKQPVLTLLGADVETYPHALAYYQWIVAGAPIMICTFVHGNLMRTEGLAKESMESTILGSVINMILDPILISVFGLGAAGAAIATVIGNLFTVVNNYRIVRNKSRILSIDYHRCSINGSFIVSILTVGLAAAVTNIMQSFGTILLNQALLPYGNDKIAAMGIAAKVSMIVMMVMVGLTFGSQPLLGYYYGSKDYLRLKKTLRYGTKLITGAALILSAVVFLFSSKLLSLFMKNENVVADGAEMLRYQVVTMVFVGLIMLMTVLFQSCGKAGASLTLSIARQGVIFALVLKICSAIFGYQGILFAQPLADIGTMLLAILIYLKTVHKEINEFA